MFENPTFTMEEILELFNYNDRKLFEAPLSRLTRAQLIETMKENEKNFLIGLEDLFWRKRSLTNYFKNAL